MSREQTILVVEDDAAVRGLTVANLRELGYTVLEAADGHKALATIDQHPEIDLLFTDIVMRGMNGRDLVEAAWRKRPRLRAMLTTGHSDMVFGDSALDSKVELIAKPYSYAELEERIRAVLA